MAKQSSEHTKLGDRIKEFRRKKDISQETLAEKVGVDRSYVGFLERGEKNPTLNTLIKIAKALNVNLSALFE
jgi:transcriptional regulator with XRE-family HTH domain